MIEPRNPLSIREMQARTTDAADSAAWIAELRNAAPVLLEIAAAALAMRGPCDHPEGRCSHGTHYRGCSKFAGEKALDVALAKVRP